MNRLIEHKVDLNGRNKWGETPLTEIIKHEKNSDKQKAFTALLLKAGANPNCANHNGQTPLEIVKCMDKIEDQQEIVRLLIAYGANPLRASTDETTKKCIRNATIGHRERVRLDSDLSLSSGTLTNVDKKLQSFFNQKYNRPNTHLSGQEDLTCIVCYKKENGPTTINIPSCSHYVHGSCLVRSLTNKSKGNIEFTPLPRYVYIHLCPCCEKHIDRSFIQDLSEFYSGIEFQRKDLTLAIRILLTGSYLIYLVPFLL